MYSIEAPPNNFWKTRNDHDVKDAHYKTTSPSNGIDRASILILVDRIFKVGSKCK
jgi:hypothetical protein